MSSLNAQLVARKVSETILAGRRVNLGEIIRNSGYSKETSLKPRLVTETKSYKAVMAPVINGMAGEIQRLKDAMAKKDLNAEEYRTLVYSLDILIKNHQILSGGPTERQVLVLPSEVIERNGLTSRAG